MTTVVGESSNISSGNVSKARDASSLVVTDDFLLYHSFILNDTHILRVMYDTRSMWQTSKHGT